MICCGISRIGTFNFAFWHVYVCGAEGAVNMTPSGTVEDEHTIESEKFKVDLM